MTLGEKIHSLRESKNISLDDFACEINVDIVTLLQYESNNLEPSLSQIKVIAEKLGVSVDYLLETKQDIRAEQTEAINTSCVTPTTINIRKDPLGYLKTAISIIYGTLWAINLVLYILLACLVEPLIAIGLIYPVLTIPFFIYDIIAINKCESKQDLTTPGILSIFFVNFIIAILMLCVSDKNANAHKYYIENNYSKENEKSIKDYRLVIWFKTHWLYIAFFFVIYLVIWGICIALFSYLFDYSSYDDHGFDSVAFLILPIPLGAILGCIISSKHGNKPITYTALTVFNWTFTLVVYLTLSKNMTDNDYYFYLFEYFDVGRESAIAYVFFIPMLFQIIIFIHAFLTYKNIHFEHKIDNKKKQKVLLITSLTLLLIGSVGTIVGVVYGLDSIPTSKDFNELQNKLHQDKLDNTSRDDAIDTILDDITSNRYNDVQDGMTIDWFSKNDRDFDNCAALHKKEGVTNYLGFYFKHTKYRDFNYYETHSIVWVNKLDNNVFGEFTLQCDNRLTVNGILIPTFQVDAALVPTNYNYVYMDEDLIPKKQIIETTFREHHRILFNKFIYHIDNYLEEYDLNGYAKRLLLIEDKQI